MNYLGVEPATTNTVMRFIKRIVFLSIVLPAIFYAKTYVYAAIAFDVATENSTASATSLTTSHTVTGSNTLLLCHYLTNNTSDIITGATQNGVSMTQMAKVQNTNNFYTYAYGLLNPSTGNNVVSFSSASLIGTQCSSYTGVSQVGLPDATSTATANSGTSMNATVTTVADNAWHWAGYRNDNSGTITAGGTMRKNSNFGGAQSIADSSVAITPSGSHSITYTATIANANIISVSFAPVATPDIGTLILFGDW